MWKLSTPWLIEKDCGTLLLNEYLILEDALICENYPPFDTQLVVSQAACESSLTTVSTVTGLILVFDTWVKYRHSSASAHITVHRNQTRNLLWYYLRIVDEKCSWEVRVHTKEGNQYMALLRLFRVGRLSAYLPTYWNTCLSSSSSSFLMSVVVFVSFYFCAELVHLLYIKLSLIVWFSDCLIVLNLFF